MAPYPVVINRIYVVGFIVDLLISGVLQVLPLLTKGLLNHQYRGLPELMAIPIFDLK